MDAVSDPSLDAVLFVACSQGGGKTEILLNIAGYYMAHDPSPILIVEPTLEMADALSKDRLAGTIRATPVLRGLVGDPRAKDSENSIRHKVFNGGHVTLVGANSPSSLAMRPIRILLGDEIARWPASAGSEGAPMDIVDARTSAFWNARRYYATSPLEKETCPSWDLWQRSDQNLYIVSCPDCSHEQDFRWEQVKWERDADGTHLPATTRYECEKCGDLWDDVTRWRAIMRGGYQPQAPANRTKNRIAGYRLPAMAVIGRTLSKMVEQFLAAKGNREKLKAFVNTVLAEWWEETGESVDETGLMDRREDWSTMLPKGADVPSEVALLTLGADVNKDFVAWEVVGWGRGEESWSVATGKIYGEAVKDAAVLEEIDDVMKRAWVHAKGFEIFIRAGALDTGYATQACYRYIKPRLRRALPNGKPQFFFAIKGVPGEGKPIWPESASQTRMKIGGHVHLWSIGVDAAKDQVMARLGIAEPGPGYCHFPLTRTKDFFEELTAEKAISKITAGRSKRVWVKKSEGRRNEAFDNRGYAYAALLGIQAPPFKLKFDAEVARVEALETVALVAGESKPAPRTRPPRARRRGKRSRGYEA